MKKKPLSYFFKTEVWLPKPPEVIFEFFKQAENLDALTPPWLNFQILTPMPIDIRKDAEIDYQLKLYGVRFRWKTRITKWQPPQEFADVQIGGPYRVWNHTHRFEARDGGTLMRDEVEYIPKGGIFAPIINIIFVRKNIEKIFQYREKAILVIFGD